MRSRSIRDLLDAHPFFADLEESDREMIAGCGRNVGFDAGEVIFREGDHADYFYVIRRGRVALEVHAPDRGSLVIETLSAGEVVGSSWLVPPHRRYLDARALEPTSAVALDADCLRDKCEEDTDLGYRLFKRFTRLTFEHLRAARLQLLDLYGDDRADRAAG